MATGQFWEATHCLDCSVVSVFAFPWRNQHESTWTLFTKLQRGAMVVNMRAIPVWLIESRAKLVEALLAAKRTQNAELIWVKISSYPKSIIFLPNYRWHPVAKKDDHHGAQSFCGFISIGKKPMGGRWNGAAASDILILPMKLPMVCRTGTRWGSYKLVNQSPLASINTSIL